MAGPGAWGGLLVKRFECSEKITFVYKYILYCAYSYTPDQFIDKVIKYFEPQNCHNDKIM